MELAPTEIIGKQEILRIALFHNAPSGGAKRAIYEWVRRLAADHLIDAFSLTTADHNFCDIRPFVREHHVFGHRPRPLFDSPLGRLNQWQRWRDLRDLADLGRTIACKIDEGAYDVVFAHTCQYTHAPLLLQFVQTPSVYYLHEPVGPHFSRPISRPYVRKRSLRRFVDRLDPLDALFRSTLATAQRKVIGSTTMLLANSRFTQDSMQRGYGVMTQVCYCGVDYETFSPRSAIEKAPAVISVGELSARKGFDFIVQAIGHIPAEKRPRLQIVSNVVQEAERTYIQKLADQYDVQLQLLKELDSEALAIEYNRALLCVYAPVMEPLGLVPLEAMACETPVVAVAEGGVRDTVLDGLNGRLTPRDPAAFAEAVRELLDDPLARAQLGRRARQHVIDEWSWEKSAREVEQHLRHAAHLAPSRSPRPLPA